MSEQLTPKRKLSNKAKALIAAGTLTAASLGVAGGVNAMSDSDESPKTSSTEVPTTTTEAPSTTTSEKPKPTTTIEAPTTTTTAKPPETTTTTEAPKQQWELDVEAMQTRQVGDNISFLWGNLIVKPDTALLKGPSLSADPIVKGGGDNFLVVNPEFQQKPDGEFICWNNGGQLVCSNDFPNITLKNIEDGSEVPFSPANAGLAPISTIDFIDEKLNYYIKAPEDMGENLTEHGMRIAQQVQAYTAVK